MASKLVTEGKSIIHDNLNRDTMFKDGWWLQYCICSGTVLGNVGNPLCGGEYKELCEHGTFECTEVGNPFCMQYSICLCITEQCQFPKLESSPTCVCCNKKLAGDSGDGWKPQLFEFTGSFDKQFWIYYFLCMGYACQAPGSDGKPMLAAVYKELCLKGGMKCVPPVEEGVLCAQLVTEFCFWGQCQFPPAANNPKFACCGWKLNKEAGGGGGKPAPMAYGKPAQAEMS